jgi:hypothetical protein
MKSVRSAPSARPRARFPPPPPPFGPPRYPMRTTANFALVLWVLTALSGCCGGYGRHGCLFGRHSACVDQADWCSPHSEFHGKGHRGCGCHGPATFPRDCGCDGGYAGYPVSIGCGCAGVPNDCGCGSSGVMTYDTMSYDGVAWGQPQMAGPWPTGCSSCGGQGFMTGAPPATFQAAPSEPAAAPASEYYSPNPTPAPTQSAPAPPPEGTSHAAQPALLIPAGL